MKNEKIEKILNSLSAKEKSAVYRKLRVACVSEDVKSYARDNNIALSEEIINDIAESYVYCGNYDNDLGYWINIKNLVNQFI